MILLEINVGDVFYGSAARYGVGPDGPRTYKLEISKIDEERRQVCYKSFVCTCSEPETWEPRKESKWIDPMASMGLVHEIVNGHLSKNADMDEFPARGRR